MTPELWGKTKSTNNRRRFYKIILQRPEYTALEDYGNIYNMIDIEYSEAIGRFPLPPFEIKRTGPVHDHESQVLYGERRLILRLFAPVTSEQAKGLRDEYLKQHAHPYLFWESSGRLL